ncbi:MAG: IclR family transcriptional regulator [Lachnospiraceae bacterium]|nr:IclR family transcriptional regulator [Lachnospiraceae bacterium]
MKLNRTTLRTIQILKLVSKRPDGITLDEICQELDLPKTSAYDIVVTLVETGMILVSRGQKQRYRIGLTAYRIGVSYTNNLDYIRTIEPVLKDFSREVGKTVFFGVRSDDEIVYLCKFEPENPIITTATVGTRNPIYCTSLGKAILAFTEEEEKEKVLDKIIFSKKTEQTITTRAALKKELEQIQKKGYALDAREVEEHMECVGAPVFNRDGEVLGAISVSSLYKPTEDYETLGRTVREKAREVSKLMGFLGKI